MPWSLLQRRTWIEKKKLLGWCVQCGSKKSRSDKKNICHHCYSRVTERRRVLYRERRSLGLCYRCGEKSTTTMCAACNLKRGKRPPDCHPDRPYFALGLCHSCHVGLRQPYQPEKRWRNRLRKNFGLSETDYLSMLARQNGACAICGVGAAHVGNGTKMKHLDVDHDHKLKINRGLLCGYCNRGLGLFQDNVALLARAIAYLSPDRVLDAVDAAR